MHATVYNLGYTIHYFHSVFAKWHLNRFSGKCDLDRKTSFWETLHCVCDADIWWVTLVITLVHKLFLSYSMHMQLIKGLLWAIYYFVKQTVLLLCSTFCFPVVWTIISAWFVAAKVILLLLKSIFMQICCMLMVEAECNLYYLRTSHCKWGSQMPAFITTSELWPGTATATSWLLVVD